MRRGEKREEEYGKRTDEEGQQTKGKEDKGYVLSSYSVSCMAHKSL